MTRVIGFLCFSLMLSLVLELQRGFFASVLLESRAFPELSSLVCSCLFIAFGVFLGKMSVGIS